MYLTQKRKRNNPSLGNKQCIGHNRSIHLNEYNSVKAVLAWTSPDPEQPVIGGYSAGSLDVLIWSAKAAKRWEVEQKVTKFQVLANSYTGVFPEHNVCS
ncbi:hypothetical protein PF005_g3617 [Phytophthora fragariae]|uniref:Uncharacterized protein n=1 Tax=Phytophthora fragariae TaxID=53985 RepID=A0A6A3L2J9_9STRA|nr:hypothetical protein PF003_g21496 [Phytophthora fragariae]KAE8944485.1 hypothetical protein PF009_g5846 [Phytophthora fragariae]KAE9010024.1 hypothetical protein PF011_g10001 [Phytophthora fragariae]KAE9132709.1 hypothetical protein PF007_g3626 [Phytophthora fragariae]KAE9152736.1 hypothetical protein PF006_g3073 [Phytophthora fragariae]